MISRMVDSLTEAVERRHFLGRMVSACSAVALALFGFDQTAKATLYYKFCCALCSSKSCNGDYSQCTGGTWCWLCQFPFSGSPVGPDTVRRCYVYGCIECYNSSAPTDCISGACSYGPLQCGDPCNPSYYICSGWVLVRTTCP